MSVETYGSDQTPVLIQKKKFRAERRSDNSWYRGGKGIDLL